MASKTILVIDDDPDIRFFCTNLLEAEGYRVVTADNEADGLELAAKESPALVILDIMMERINSGYAVAEKIGKETPILMFSSMLSSNDATFDPESVPYCDVIGKPVPGDKLLEKVRNLIQE